MKTKLLNTLTAFALFLIPGINFGQAPALGTAADFVLFSTNGAVSNSGISQLTGNVGTNNGLSTAFGNVNGSMHDNDGVSAQCAADLLIAYNNLNSTTATFFPAALLGNGQVLIPGVYSISAAATLNLDLTLNAQNNPNAVFIFQIQGSLSTNANSKIKLINGAQACNVFWKVEGLVSMASGTTMRGTVIANNAAISMSTNDTLEGRALSTAGAVTVDGILAYTPIGCGSPLLVGPSAPNLASTACYALFSSSGAVTNAGVTFVTGDIGTNVGLTTGYNASDVSGNIHPIPDVSTGTCAADLGNVYTYLNTLPYDIELLYPAQFGNNLVLTPHTYMLNAATIFTNALYLNAEGDANAVFVIQINGALSTSTYSKVILTNGTQAKNVFWKVDGAVQINNYSDFKGTLVCNNGAVSLNTGTTIEGRIFTTSGSFNTDSIIATMPVGCGTSFPPNIVAEPTNKTVCIGNAVSFAVTATGTGLTYQWRKGNVNLSNGGAISGATSSTLTINPAATSNIATNYNVIVSGSSAPNDTSVNVSLTANTIPVITAQPVGQTLCEGSPVSFSVTTTGTGLTYQWKKGTSNLVNGTNISGATSSTLTINSVSISDAASNYNVVVIGTCTPQQTSVNVSLSVSVAPSITTAPVNETACVGGSVNFSVVAAGTSLTYQWRKGTVNLINGGAISGATSASLIINPMSISDTASNYNVVVSGACTPQKISVNASLSKCSTTGIVSLNGDVSEAATFYPNPWKTSLTLTINNASEINSSELRIYTILGTLVINRMITDQITTLDTNLPAGVYFYQVIGKNKTVQSGKLISQQ
jgi:hypothetical protein